MVDTSLMFGFEILQTIYDSQILKKEDILILLVHWSFLKNGFRCIGFGDSKAYDSSERGSELLPEGWNTHPNYALRYVNDKKLYIFHGIRSDEDFLLNLLRTDDQNVSNAQFPINQTVNSLHGPLESTIPTHQDVLRTIQRDLIDPVLFNSTAGTSGTVQSTSTQTSSTERTILVEPNPDPLRVGPSTRPPLSIHPWDPAADPTRVGSADLNPLARGGDGGGMIFNPFGPSVRNPIDPYRPNIGVPGRLPPGSVPPFARFDPFGPPDNNPPRPRRNPDNDGEFPPGYDDMFM